MRLLLDENLSPRLVSLLADAFPGSVHVRDVGLASAHDETVWRYAAEAGLAVVSRDSDFNDRAVLRGPPPKVVWVRRGNCSTRDVERLLRAHREEVEHFTADPATAVLALS